MAGTAFGIGLPATYPQIGHAGLLSSPAIVQTVQQQLYQLQQLEYIRQQQIQQLQQVVQTVAHQLQQLQQIVQSVPHQLQQPLLQQQPQPSPFATGIFGVSGFGVPASAGGVSSWSGSPTFYPQPGQVM